MGVPKRQKQGLLDKISVLRTVRKRCLLSKQRHFVGLITCDYLVNSDFMTLDSVSRASQGGYCQYNLPSKSKCGHIKLLSCSLEHLGEFVAMTEIDRACW